MNARFYRRMKVVVGTLVLACCTLVFADIGNVMSLPFVRAALWVQFTPSLLAMMHGAGWLATGCVAVVVLTLLFGRVYCAMLCPLGVLMDLTAKLAGRSGRNRKLPYRKGRPWLAAMVAITAAAGLAMGTALPLAFVDPYSVFGKMVSSTLRPILGWANHAMAFTTWVHPVDVSPVSWIMGGVALGLIGIIGVMAIRRGRLWCNTVCPVGSLLGFFSRHAMFRLGIEESACVECSMCERVCPAQCIDFKNQSIDHSRCVMCLDCVTSCRKNGISAKQHWSWRREPAVPRAAVVTDANDIAPLPDLSRRLFLASAVLIPCVSLAEDRHQSSGGTCGKGGGGGHGQGCRGGLNQFNKRAVLPPGAISLEHFQSTCTGCQLCVVHCPEQVLRPSITQHGLAGFLQPFQDFDSSFCSYNCSDCSHICPTGAIQPISVEERKTVQTGVAEFFRGRCVVKTEGTSCGACSEHCPTQAVHMVPWKNGLTIPEVEPELCIGCGGCEFICPVRPHKAIIVNGLKVHQRSKVVIRGKENTVREIEEEFPF
jgi:polyferredoxin